MITILGAVFSYIGVLLFFNCGQYDENKIKLGIFFFALGVIFLICALPSLLS